jgi:hypothetical protein
MEKTNETNEKDKVFFGNSLPHQAGSFEERFSNGVHVK